jgi:hypothetical protein
MATFTIGQYTLLNPKVHAKKAFLHSYDVDVGKERMVADKNGKLIWKGGSFCW